MQIFKFLAAFLAIATLGIIGCGEKAAESGTEGQYANPSEMMGEAGEMADPTGEEAPAEEAPAEEAPAEEAPAEEAPAEEAPAEEAPAEEAPAEEAPAEEAPAEEAAEGEG